MQPYNGPRGREEKEMRKQHGVIFEAPWCPACGEEMALMRVEQEAGVWYE